LPSVYVAGNELPVFTVGDLAFGILICYESNYYYSPRYSAGFQLRRRDA
jgi:predicted amidohydrolase